MDKKIHYCWFGENPLPENAKKCIASWKKFMPDYEIIEWNESNFDIKQNRYMREAYENKMYAFVSDYARLKIIYDRGGIYFDVDVELIKPLRSDMLKNGYFGKEDGKHINTGLGFAAKKGDKTVRKMLDDYEGISFVKIDGSFDRTACPIRNTKSIERDIERKDKIDIVDGKPIFPKTYFNPLNWRTDEFEIKEDTYSIHYGNASWFNDIQRLRLKKRKWHIKKYGKVLGLTIFKIKRLFRIVK